MDVIAMYSERWQIVHFELPLFCYDILKCVKSRLPILQHISIDKEFWTDSEVDSEVALHLEMFSVAPLLRRLDMRGIDLYDFDLPTDQVTKLTLECDYVSEFLDMLRDSPLAINCLCGGLSIPNPSDQLHHARASQLDTLQLGFELDYDGSISDVFDALTLPVLRELSCYASEHDFPHSSFISLISRSSCSLQSLCLESWKTSDSQFVECLGAMPSLQKLFLTEVTITNETLRLLDAYHPPDGNRSNCSLPNLIVFEFRGPVDDFKLDPTVLVSFMRSRRFHAESMPSDNGQSHIARIQSVKFESVDSAVPDDNILAYLQYLVYDGMEIILDTSAGKFNRPVSNLLIL
jgi:hypothetical protein